METSGSDCWKDAGESDLLPSSEPDVEVCCETSRPSCQIAVAKRRKSPRALLTALSVPLAPYFAARRASDLRSSAERKRSRSCELRMEADLWRTL